MKKIGLIIVCIAMASLVKAQGLDFDWDRSIAKVKGTIKLLSEETVVIVPDDNPNGRYITEQIPAEYRKEGLKVVFSGDVAKIPPNARMIGTPIWLKEISVSKKDKKKHKLKKAKYTFGPRPVKKEVNNNE
jgi:hypothetical protein